MFAFEDLLMVVEHFLCRRTNGDPCRRTVTSGVQKRERGAFFHFPECERGMHFSFEGETSKLFSELCFKMIASLLFLIVLVSSVLGWVTAVGTWDVPNTFYSS